MGRGGIFRARTQRRDASSSKARRLPRLRGSALRLEIARNANDYGGLNTPEGAKNRRAVSVEYPVQLARAVKGLSGYTGPTVF